MTRKAALLLPRGRTRGDGPNDFQVNRTACGGGHHRKQPAGAGGSTLTGGPSPKAFDPAALTAMPQHTARLSIACVEGWSTIETWTGVRLRDLARLAGVPNPLSAFVRSVSAGWLQPRHPAGQSGDHPDSLLALRVNDADLSPDHGYPARIIVPGLPGVHNTKWVAAIDFRAV